MGAISGLQKRLSVWGTGAWQFLQALDNSGLDYTAALEARIARLERLERASNPTASAIQEPAESC